MIILFFFGRREKEIHVVFFCLIVISLMRIEEHISQMNLDELLTRLCSF